MEDVTQEQGDRSSQDYSEGKSKTAAEPGTERTDRDRNRPNINSSRR